MTRTISFLTPPSVDYNKGRQEPSHPYKGFLPYPLHFKAVIMNRCIDCGIAIKDYFERCYGCNNIRKINRDSGSIDLNPEIKINFMKQMGIYFC